MNKKIKFLVYRWHAYNQFDLEENLSAMGYELDVYTHEPENCDYDEEFSAEFGRKLQQGNFDAVISINYFTVVSNVCEAHDMIYIAWNCDSPLFSMQNQSIFNDCNRIFCFDSLDCLKLKELGVEHVWHLPLCADTRRIDALLQDRCGEIENYRGEVAFVGSLYEENSYDSLKETLPEYIRGYCDAAILAQTNISGGNILDRMITEDILMDIEEIFDVKQEKDSFVEASDIFVNNVLGFKAASDTRISILSALGETTGVELYSESERVVSPGIRRHGTVSYWSEMPLVFAGSEINLNITIPNIRSGVPLRVFDVLAAGGFLITNYQPELSMLFDIGVDLVVYDDTEDLLQKVSYYREHPQERKAIAENGRKKVADLHTYFHRLQEMLEKVTGIG